MPDPAPSERADKAIVTALASGGFGANAPALTRTRVQALIAEGLVTVDDEALVPSAQLEPGMEVELTVPAPTQLDLKPVDRDLEILYEDDHLAIVNKPQGLSVHPSDTDTSVTLVHVLLHKIQNLSGIGGRMRPGIVHRLDKDTSGALVVSKTDAAHQGLVELFSKHDIERRYWALVYGVPRDLNFTVQSTLGRNPTDRRRMAENVRGGRTAVTRVSVLEPFAFASLLEVRLETGRTHQVRVHLTGKGHSVLGDPLYGTPTTQQPKWKALPGEIQEAVSELPGQALHARVLGFRHPITGKEIRVEAEAPAPFRNLLDRLRSHKTE